MKITILVPIYNDWQSVTKLVDEINNLTIDGIPNIYFDSQ